MLLWTVNIAANWHEISDTNTDYEVTHSLSRQPAQVMEHFAKSNSFQSLEVKLMQKSSVEKALFF